MKVQPCPSEHLTQSLIYSFCQVVKVSTMYVSNVTLLLEKNWVDLAQNKGVEELFFHLRLLIRDL